MWAAASACCHAHGVDLDRALLRTPLSPGLAQADACYLPFPPASFDCLTATNLLFLLEEPLCALREWVRVLKPGSGICLLNWAGYAEQHARWTEAETRDLFSKAGLELVESLLRVGPGFAGFARGRLH